MKLGFKLAATDDAGLLVDLYNASFFSDYQRFGTCPGYGKTIEMMEESIRLYPKHIILCDNRPVGCISCYSNAPQEYEIGCLCVIPEYQGKGIGTQAVQFVKDTGERTGPAVILTAVLNIHGKRHDTENHKKT